MNDKKRPKKKIVIIRHHQQKEDTLRVCWRLLPFFCRCFIFISSAARLLTDLSSSSPRSKSFLLFCCLSAYLQADSRRSYYYHCLDTN